MADHEPPDWDRLVADHAQRVFRVAVRVVGSVHDAEDVSQEVFVEAFRLRQTESVKDWTGLLVRLATLRSIDRLRRMRPTSELRETDRVSAVEPFQEAAAADLANWLRKALARLPNQQAAVFVMHHFEQLARDDIATALGISPAAVSTALYKARQRLLEQLSAVHRGDSK
jgi:RNA polymerase sigma-70 factor (ECF subfamily)